MIPLSSCQILKQNYIISSKALNSDISTKRTAILLLFFPLYSQKYTTYSRRLSTLYIDTFQNSPASSQVLRAINFLRMAIQALVLHK